MIIDLGTKIKLKRGEQQAFATIYSRYWERVYGFARLYVNIEADAKDIVQDVFVKLWEMREHIDESQDLDNLLFIITRNHIFRLNRRKVNRSQVHLTALQALDYIEDPHDVVQDISASELKHHIASIVDRLPPRRKEVFLMSYAQNLSHAEISTQLAISVRAVERHIYLSMVEIKKGLKATYGDRGIELFQLTLIIALYYYS
ncbi:MAG: RNA polymerase sigma-70 factor [Mediterranea sp.]|nr:RNA polymerase sigma-70 factor [Mediterranea sp.]